MRRTFVITPEEGFVDGSNYRCHVRIARELGMKPLLERVVAKTGDVERVAR